MVLVAVISSFLLLGAALTWYLLKYDQGKKEPVGYLWAVFGLGVAGMIAAVFLEGWLIPAKDLSLVVHQPYYVILRASLGVGAIEECAKFLPTALLVYKRKFFRSHVDGIIFFAIAGLAFGIPENILYSIEFGATTGLQRLLLDPIFHASTTVMVGYFLSRAKVDNESLVKTGLALLAAIVLHGFYDFGLFSLNPYLTLMSVLITVMLAVGLFIFFFRAKQLDRQDGLAVVGNNNYCRHCGVINSQHGLFCTHCGAHA